MFGLPSIKGDPLQQELPESVERKVDRLYRLTDGSILNIEHQSTLRDKQLLAMRMALYRIRIRRVFKSKVLHQIVIYTGPTPKKRSKVPQSLEWDDMHGAHGGLKFSVPVRDLLSESLETFRRSGHLDDMMLGILGPGRGNSRYIAEVADRVRLLSGEEARAAKEKFVAACATVGIEPIETAQEFAMWIKDVRDSKVVRDIVDIASPAVREYGSKEALAKILVEILNKRGEGIDDGIADTLATYVELDILKEMVENIIEDREVRLAGLLERHNVQLPGFGI